MFSYAYILDMKTLGINIDGVIRDFHSQFDKQYRKVYIHNPSLVAMEEETMTVKLNSQEEDERIENLIKEKERDLITLPITSFDLINHYKFVSKSIEMSKFIEMDNTEGINLAPIEYTPKQNLDKFLYDDYPFQIFGNAEEYQGAMDAVNKIQSIGLTKGKFDVILLSTHKAKAIAATYFFLSKFNCRIRKIQFLNSDDEKWSHCDALVDIMPTSFQSKPQGANKTSIKINHPFNQWDTADYSYNSVKEIANENFFDRIFTDNQ